MNEIQIVLIDVPVSFRGGVIPEADGSYTIYLNARYSVEERRNIFNHEVCHLLKGHHYLDGRAIEDIESEADDNRTLLENIKDVEQNGLPLGVPLLPKRRVFDDARVALQNERERIWNTLSAAIGR